MFQDLLCTSYGVELTDEVYTYSMCIIILYFVYHLKE